MHRYRKRKVWVICIGTIRCGRNPPARERSTHLGYSEGSNGYSEYSRTGAGARADDVVLRVPFREEVEELRRALGRRAAARPLRLCERSGYSEYSTGGTPRTHMGVL